MSTIASPREPRRLNSLTTPTSSARPSLDSTRSPVSSPNPNNNSLSAPNANPRRNRAALREYYNIRKGAGVGTATPPQVEVTDSSGGSAPHEHSEVPPSELDKEGFDADAFVKKALAENGMQALLRLYTRVLGETRALDAEKPPLVYGNYSKLITATETIRKVSSVPSILRNSSYLGPRTRALFKRMAKR